MNKVWDIIPPSKTTKEVPVRRPNKHHQDPLLTGYIPEDVLEEEQSQPQQNTEEKTKAPARPEKMQRESTLWTVFFRFSAKQILLAITSLAATTAFVLFSFNVQHGQWFIAAYGLTALVLRIQSQITFSLALVALTLVPVLTFLNDEIVAEYYAVYAYLLLVVGIISAIIEQWRGD